MLGQGSMWFMDAASLGGWTARGTAKVLQDRLSGLPEDSRPPWMDDMTPAKLEDILTKVIVDAVEASQVVEEYMDTEKEKGREFEDIYNDVKPYLDRVSRPIEEDLKDGTLEARSADMKGDMESELKSKATARERKQQHAPHRNLVVHKQDAVQEHFGADEFMFGGLYKTATPSQIPPSPREAAAASAKEGRPPSDALRSVDVAEPLVLVGCCNGWRVDEARRLHSFHQCADNTNERFVRVKVPKNGLRFQILSADKEWQWRLFPSKKGTLHRGEDRASPAGLAMGPDADDKAKGKDFKVKGDKGYGFVDIRVVVDLERGARIWITEVEGQETTAAITYPGME